MSNWPAIEVKLITETPVFSARTVGMYYDRKSAFREAKRAAGFRPTLIQRDQEVGYKGENGMAWIIL